MLCNLPRLFFVKKTSYTHCELTILFYFSKMLNFHLYLNFKNAEVFFVQVFLNLPLLNI